MRSSLASIVAALVLLGCGVLLSACSDDNKYDETRDWSADKLYTEAKDELTSGNYKKAIGYYEKLEARFPYGKLAQQAQLEVAYAYFKDKDSVSALAAADRFIKLHPNHPNVDYLYYLKGLCNFNGDLGILGYLGGQDMTERDPKAAREAFDAFKDLVTRFPESKYAPDSVARMNYLVNALASHEIHVARYYLKRGAYVAALNRAQYSLKTYPQAPANEDGLLVMVEAYDALGMNDLRDDARRVMAKNFPENKSATMADKADKRWWQIWNW
jgi:outer membrane protein assembly factor BamD